MRADLSPQAGRGEGEAMLLAMVMLFLKGSLSVVIARSEATKQSSFPVVARKLDCFAMLAMTVFNQTRNSFA
jgi:hypothetical protein